MSISLRKTPFFCILKSDSNTKQLYFMSHTLQWKNSDDSQNWTMLQVIWQSGTFEFNYFKLDSLQPVNYNSCSGNLDVPTN